MPDDNPPDNDDQTTLALKLPKTLRMRIRQAAQKEERSESAFARYHLGRIAEQVLASEPQPADAQ